MNRVTDCINSPRFQGVSGGMLPQKILKLQNPIKRFPAFRGLNRVQKSGFSIQEDLGFGQILIYYLATRLTPASNEQNNGNYTKLHTFLHEQILLFSMTLFKLAASSSEKKIADFSEQCSRHVSSVVSAY